MPFFAREYGLHPWHFGGPDELTEWEARIFRDDAEATIRARQRAQREQQRRRRR